MAKGLRYRISCSGGWELNVHSVGDVKHLSACGGTAAQSVRAYSGSGHKTQHFLKPSSCWSNVSASRCAR